MSSPSPPPPTTTTTSNPSLTRKEQAIPTTALSSSSMSDPPPPAVATGQAPHQQQPQSTKQLQFTIPKYPNSSMYSIPMPGGSSQELEPEDGVWSSTATSAPNNPVRGGRRGAPPTGKMNDETNPATTTTTATASDTPMDSMNRRHSAPESSLGMKTAMSSAQRQSNSPPPPPSTKTTTTTTTAQPLPAGDSENPSNEPSHNESFRSEMNNTNNNMNDKWVVMSQSLFFRALLGLFIALALGTTGTIMGIYNTVSYNNDDDDDGGSGCQNCGIGPNSNLNNNPLLQQQLQEQWELYQKQQPGYRDANSTLYQILQRGHINCGVGPEGSPGFFWKKQDGSGNYVGMELDLCIALAAALFEDMKPVEDISTIQDLNQPRFRLIPIPPEHRFRYLQHPQPRSTFAALQGKASSSTSDSTTTAAAMESLDVLFRSTHTMERDVHEASTQTGFTFSTPYLWDNLVMGGSAAHVQCAETLDFTSQPTCADTIVCVTQGTTHETILRDFLQVPMSNVILVQGDAVDGLLSPSTTTTAAVKRCNVIASERAFINPLSLQARGYDIRDYTLGTKIFSKEPIALVTRQGDPTWSDFVEWVMQTLIYSEEEEISRTMAHIELGLTDLFSTNTNDTSSPLMAANGTVLHAMFPRAVAARGNYGEIYNFNVQSFMPRNGLNRLNKGNSPIMYAFPFGPLMATTSGEESQPPPLELEVRSPTVRAIKARGFLNCGISSRTGFAEFDRINKEWTGLDVDFCRALAAALFDGVDRASVVFTDLPASHRFPVLVQQRVDVLARLTTLTYSRDVQETQTGVGLSFAAPYIYDGLTFGGIPPFDECANNLDVITPECQTLVICVLQGTTMQSRVIDLFHEDYISTRLTFQEMIEGLNDGTCNAIAGGMQDVAEPTLRERGFAGNYSVGDTRYSKDPLALTTTQVDPYWTDFVRWVFWSLIYAEERNITQETAYIDMPRTTHFGTLRTDAFYLAVNAVGNYGEVYERNFESLIPRVGMHLLNVENGPMLYAMPGIPRT